MGKHNLHIIRDHTTVRWAGDLSWICLHPVKQDITKAG